MATPLVVKHNRTATTPDDPLVEVGTDEWNDSHQLTGELPPSRGGTGKSNNDASTITITGSFGVTFTVAATTALTLPSAGTVAILDSPAFINNPTAPTQAVDNNSTRLATTAYVIGQASAAGDGTPAMDGTAARGTSIHWARADHIHPTDTSRVSVTAGAFTTAAPTSAAAIAADDNTTKLATTAWVLGQAYTSNPAMNGTAGAGSSTRWARGDHVHPSDTSRLALTGGTVTGALTISYATPVFTLQAVTSGDPRIVLDKRAASGTNAIINGKRGNVSRWELCLGDATTAETGSDVGSDVSVWAFTDAGVLKSQALTIFRSNSNLQVANQALKPSGGPWSDSSDARIKNVVGDYTRGLEHIIALRPVYYSFKGNDTLGPPANLDDLQRQKGAPKAAPYPNSPHYQVAQNGTRYAGLIAQEVEQVIPEMVTTREAYIDGQPVTDLHDLDTGPLIYALVNSVKTLNDTIQTLQARIEALESGAAR